MDRDGIAESIRRHFATDPHEVVAVYLFGSTARDTAGPGSDIDIAVLFTKTPAAKLESPPARHERFLEAALGKSVQLVDLHTAPVNLVHRVLRDGLLLVDNDRSRRIRFEVQARNAYFDLLPTLRRYRRDDGVRP